MTFSASDAAFEGFRVVRRKPMLLVWWALAYIVFFGVIFALVGPGMISMVAAAERLEAAGPTADPAQVTAAMAPFFGMFLVLVPLGMLIKAVFQAAVVRAVVTPAQSRFGYLRIGMDELRVVGVVLVLGLLLGVAYFAMALVVGVVAGISAAAGGGALYILVGVAVIAAICALIWAAVRLSLAVPITVAEKRFALFDSFALTKGRFWSLLGMIIIVGVMCMLIALLSSAVMLPFTFMTGGMERLVQMEGQDLQAILAAAAPAVIAWVIVNSVTSALMLAVIYAPFSVAYLALKGQPTPTAD